MNYRTYWSIADTPSHSIKTYSVFLVIALVSIAAWILIKKFKKNNPDYDKTILLWCVGAVAALTTIMFFLTAFVYPDKTNEEVMKILQSPHIQIAEAVISDFERSYRRPKYRDETIETFKVDTVTFHYGDTPFGRFNYFGNTNNGVFRNGLPVRISYIKGNSDYDRNVSILKIEVGDE